MESSDAETGMVDCGVGTIVWVRRRNGSWWPGKILGPVELSASHLMSPRSGTPVKLLGREDASVDWYNLEKSKRVKPFRCGEFDDCIERAEASQGMPPKKREKYARREDAILHALELEKQLVEKKSSVVVVEESSKLAEETSCGVLITAAQEPRPSSSSRLREAAAAKHVNNNNNGSHHKHAAAAAGESSSVLEKRKREEETLSKRRDRRLPLVQVLKSSAKLYPLLQQSYAAAAAADGTAFDYNSPNFEENNVGLLSEENNAGSNEDTETDSSGTESLLSDTYDSMAAALLDEGENIEFIPKAAFGEDTGSTSDELSGGDSLPIQKWQLKGKRNTRSSSSSSRYTSSMNAWMKDVHHVHVRDQQPPRMLIDVEVGVQSGYQREHVPMISLMSKLNDQAIVGHPIPVETLEDGSSLSPADHHEEEEEEEDSTTLQPWRTARRTAKCRVYRPPEEEEEEYLVHKSRKLVKSSRTSSCNQKIRTLSSIGGKSSSCAAAAGEEEQGGVMKPEPLPTAVACIPVKLVFSRLHEELVARHQ